MTMNERDFEYYNKGLAEGYKHSKSSPETIKVFDKMQKQIDDIKKIVVEDHDTTTKQGKDIAYIKETMVKFIDKADTCYASKQEVTDLKDEHNKLSNTVNSWVKLGVVNLISIVGAIILLLIEYILNQ